MWHVQILKAAVWYPCGIITSIALPTVASYMVRTVIVGTNMVLDEFCRDPQGGVMFYDEKISIHLFVAQGQPGKIFLR